MGGVPVADPSQLCDPFLPPPFERREPSRDRVSVRSVSLEPASESSSDSEDSDRSRRRRVPPRDLVYTWYDLLARSCRWSCSLKERPVRSISEKPSCGIHTTMRVVSQLDLSKASAAQKFWARYDVGKCAQGVLNKLTRRALHLCFPRLIMRGPKKYVSGQVNTRGRVYENSTTAVRLTKSSFSKIRTMPTRF